jgi:hypothetical protein
MELRLRNVRRAGVALAAAGVVTMIWGLLAEGDNTTALPWAVAYVVGGILVLAVARYVGPAPLQGAPGAVKLAASGAAVATSGVVVATVGWASDRDSLVALGLAGVAAGVVVGVTGLRRRRS